MILGFKQVFSEGNRLKRKPTNFKKKILAGTKIHSMREDVHKRWKVGMPMQLAQGVRTKFYDCFLEPGPCQLIQEVSFRYEEDRSTPVVTIDGREIGMVEQIILATNDGFDSLGDFFDYFSEGKVYRLLHWTDYKYDGDERRIKMVNDSQKDPSQM